MTASPLAITSRDNPLLKRLRLLVQDGTAYRKQGQVWLEGDHLCRALLARGQRPLTAVFTESFWPQAPHDLRDATDHVVTLPDALMAGISGLESPAGVGFVWSLPPGLAVQGGTATVVLDRLQDAGNVGSILRSASAFGFGQVLALKGTAALWSPKVVRAGMGAFRAALDRRPGSGRSRGAGRADAGDQFPPGRLAASGPAAVALRLGPGSRRAGRGRGPDGPCRGFRAHCPARRRRVAQRGRRRRHLPARQRSRIGFVTRRSIDRPGL